MNLHFNGPSSVFMLDTTLEGTVWSYVGGKRVSLYAGIILPSYSSTLDPVISIDKLQLGDGYEQVTEAGIHPIKQVYNLTFGQKPKVVATALRRFFEGEPGQGSIYDRRPSEYFFWKPLAEHYNQNNPPKKFRCEKVSITPIKFDAVTVSATFEESFEP